MTRRQREAVRWLEGKGEATQFAVKRDGGFQVRMFETLARDGHIRMERRKGRIREFAVFHPINQPIREEAA